MSNKVSSEHLFHNASGKMLSLADVVVEIRAYVEKHPESRYEVVIGSDSQAALSGEALFVTAVVVRRIGNGGVYFWTRHSEKFYAMKDRIWKEALFSITLAQELRSLFKETFGEEMFCQRKFQFR